ncbi:MAG: hypothetical protein ACRDA8_05560, partial [Shewanella sp.]
MFTLNLKKSAAACVLMTTLIGGMTNAADAEAAPIIKVPSAEIVSAIEQTLTTQAQELTVNTQRELTLSLQTQLAETFYDMNRQLN